MLACLGFIRKLFTYRLARAQSLVHSNYFGKLLIEDVEAPRLAVLSNSKAGDPHLLLSGREEQERRLRRLGLSQDSNQKRNEACCRHKKNEKCGRRKRNRKGGKEADAQNEKDDGDDPSEKLKKTLWKKAKGQELRDYFGLKYLKMIKDNSGNLEDEEKLVRYVTFLLYCYRLHPEDRRHVRAIYHALKTLKQLQYMHEGLQIMRDDFDSKERCHIHDYHFIRTFGKMTEDPTWLQMMILLQKTQDFFMCWYCPRINLRQVPREGLGLLLSHYLVFAARYLFGADKNDDAIKPADEANDTIARNVQEMLTKGASLEFTFQDRERATSRLHVSHPIIKVDNGNYKVFGTPVASNLGWLILVCSYAQLDFVDLFQPYLCCPMKNGPVHVQYDRQQPRRLTCIAASRCRRSLAQSSKIHRKLRAKIIVHNDLEFLLNCK